MKDSGSYTLKYSCIVGALCALLLTVAGAITGPRRGANAQAEKMRHVLRVLGVPFPEKARAAELVEIFQQTVNVQASEDGPARYHFDGSEDGSLPPSVALPLSGPGLWGPIKGFLSVDPSLRKIRGVTFHEQEETPGLGGEIASDWFCSQFQGKSLRGAAGNPGIVIQPGGSAMPNGVDAITGATMTCIKVQALLNETIKRALEGDKDNG